MSRLSTRNLASASNTVMASMASNTSMTENDQNSEDEVIRGSIISEDGGQTFVESVGVAGENEGVADAEGAGPGTNLVIITTASNLQQEIKDSEVTQPPAVLTAAAALGMHIVERGLYGLLNFLAVFKVYMVY